MKVKLKFDFRNFKAGEVVDIYYKTAEQLVTEKKATFPETTETETAAVVVAEKPAMA